jgi:hypothetical protein
MPPKKAARYRDKAKPLVSYANGFAMKEPVRTPNARPPLFLPLTRQHAHGGTHSMSAFGGKADMAIALRNVRL